MQWQRLFDKHGYFAIAGHGFSLQVSYPGVVRYVEGNRVMTLLSSLEDVTNERGRAWFVFRRFTLEVAIPQALAWDDGTLVPPQEQERILERLHWGLAKYRQDGYRIVVDSELYANMQAEVDSAMKNSATGHTQ